MLLKFSKHAQERMELRSISQDDVKETLRNPDETKNEPEGKTRAIKILRGRKIQVIYCKENFRDLNDQVLVITTF